MNEQIELFDLIPKNCECGTVPLLDKTVCGIKTGVNDKYMMNFICPKCGAVPKDKPPYENWIDYAHGYYNDAYAQAVKKWNSDKHEFYGAGWESVISLIRMEAEYKTMRGV